MLLSLLVGGTELWKRDRGNMSPAITQAMETLIQLIGNSASPDEKVSAVSTLALKLTGCRETAELVTEAMQPWRDEVYYEWENE